MSTITVEVSEDIAKKFAGQDIVKIDDILDYEDDKFGKIMEKNNGDSFNIDILEKKYLG